MSAQGIATYSGLCVGGPMDGQFLTCDIDYYRQYVMPPGPAAVAPSEYASTEVDLSTEVMTYQWHRALRGEVELDVWVPVPDTTASALRQIIEHYHRGEARSKLRKERLRSAIRARVEITQRSGARYLPGAIADAIIDLFDFGDEE